MSNKPKPYIAKPQPVEPQTWDDFLHQCGSNGIRRLEQPLGDAMMRVKIRTAAALLIRLRDAGCEVGIENGKRFIRPPSPEAVTEDDRKLIGMVGDELAMILEGEPKRGRD